jgi:hypothetical protein
MNYPNHFYVFFFTCTFACIRNLFLLFIISESFHLVLVKDTRRPKPCNFMQKRLFFPECELGVVREVFFCHLPKKSRNRNRFKELLGMLYIAIRCGILWIVLCLFHFACKIIFQLICNFWKPESSTAGKKKEKVHFWPSNYRLSLVLAIELQNQISLTIQLSKPFKFGH